MLAAILCNFPEPEVSRGSIRHTPMLPMPPRINQIAAEDDVVIMKVIEKFLQALSR